MPPKIKLDITNDQTSSEIDAGVNLSESLNASNSNILFGCRTGICGTCLVKVIEGTDGLEPPSEDEKEFLEIVSEGEEGLRLACQLSPNTNLKVEYRGKS